MDQPNFYLYKATIVKVSDGDSFWAIVDLGFGITRKQKFRLADIDTPEIFSSKANEAEKIHGRQAKNRAVELMLNKEVWIESIKDKQGKYGRFLAVVFLPEHNEFLSAILYDEELDKQQSYQDEQQTLSDTSTYTISKTYS